MMNGHILPFLGESKKTEMLDSASGQAVQVVENLDAKESSASALNAEIQSVRKMALMLVLVLVDSIVENDLGDDELPSDRLDSLLAGFASEADDEEFEADQATLDILIANVQDAFASLGVSDELIATIFSEESEADEAIESACELVESTLPTGDDLQEFVDLFVYGEAQDDGDTMLDGALTARVLTGLMAIPRAAGDGPDYAAWQAPLPGAPAAPVPDFTLYRALVQAETKKV